MHSAAARWRFRPIIVSYTCQIEGHKEQGLINVFAQLAATSDENQDPAPPPIILSPATKGQPITRQQVLEGGLSPYAISSQLFQITDGHNKVIQSGSGIGPGLQLQATINNTGIWVTGTPTVSGNYNFTCRRGRCHGGEPPAGSVPDESRLRGIIKQKEGQDEKIQQQNRQPSPPGTPSQPPGGAPLQSRELTMVLHQQGSRSDRRVSRSPRASRSRFWGDHPAEAQNLGSPAFANPSEVSYRAGEKRLRAVMQLMSGKYSIPNVGTATLRQCPGLGCGQARTQFQHDPISPGPTLRARLRDLVEISFLNKIDDVQFPYTFDTTSTPGHSGFGCDQSGTIYPGQDTFHQLASTAPAPPTSISMAPIPVRMGWATTCSSRFCHR